MRYLYGAAMEEFPPSDLIVQAREAEEAGFDGLCCSDHLQPWWEPGQSGHAWVYLGAAAAATQRLALGTGVTAPVHRHNPVMVAQAFATLEEIAPGRAFLGIGSGESLNESPCGMDWPEPGEQIARMEEALEIINRLFDGERVTHEGEFFQTKAAFLHTRPERRPPIYVSAFGERAAKVAGPLGDGVWSLADPERVPPVLDAYRGAAENAGREAGEVLLHIGFSWAPDDDTAFESARHWKATQPPEFYTEDWHDPKAMFEHAEREVSDDEFRESFILTADLEEHVERVRLVEELGATTVVLMNISVADPHAAIRAYGEHVLPRLRARSTAGSRS